MNTLDKMMKNLTKEQMKEAIQLFNPYMDDYLYLMDLKEDTYVISQHAAKRFMLPSDSFGNAAASHELFVYGEDYSFLQEEFELLCSGKKKAHNLHYRWLNREGKPVWINCRGGVLEDDEGNPRYLVGCINETGKKQRADNVSGLLGGPEFFKHMDTSWNQCSQGFLMRLGIDNFSEVNSISGLDYGDYVIKKVADCIKECLEEGQQVFHVVADEYMVVDIKRNEPQDIQRLYQKIRNAIAEFIDAENYKAAFTISAGVVNKCVFTDSYEEAVRLTDFALKQAKKRSKNNLYLYRQEDYDLFIRRKTIMTDLQYAVDNRFEGFDVFYQPIVDTQTSKLIGAEALMRFYAPSKEGPKMISPAEFVPIMEETGLILPVGRWILDRAISMCSDMQQVIPGFKININISYIQVIKSNILKDIVSSMKRYRLPPECLGIELTESGFLDSDMHFHDFRNGLMENRIQFIIDDFGTGYSNLHCISDLSPSYIKIDREFTCKAMQSTYDHELLVKIIEMAHSLKIRICVEGVETMEVRDEIARLDADYIQGYLFGKPCSKSEFYEKYVS